MLVVLRLPIIVVIGSVLTVVPPIVCVVPGVKCPRGTSAAHPTSGATMGERNNALRLGETNRVGVRAVGVFVITSLAVEAVLANWALPDGVGRVKLFTEVAAVWEWKGSLGAAGQHFFVVILGHGKPLETVVAGIFYCGGYDYSSGAHFCWLIVVRDEGAVIKVWMNAGDNPGFGKAVSGLSIPNPPVRPFIG